MSHAVKARRARRTFASPEHPGRGVFSEEAWDLISAAMKLSPRELQIIQFIFDDCSEGKMGEAIGISVHTIHSHLDRIYWKLGACSRASLIVRVCAAHFAVVEAQAKLEARLNAELEAAFETELQAAFEAGYDAASESETRAELQAN